MIIDYYRHCNHYMVAHIIGRAGRRGPCGQAAGFRKFSFRFVSFRFASLRFVLFRCECNLPWCGAGARVGRQQGFRCCDHDSDHDSDQDQDHDHD